jgi:hypothetical protein
MNDISKRIDGFIEKVLQEKLVTVHPKTGAPFQRRMKVDTEHMSQIGKVGFQVTSKKIMDMMNDPNANAEDVYNISRWFARRIKQTTVPYRTQWWRSFRETLKNSGDKQKATMVASSLIREMSGHG